MEYVRFIVLRAARRGSCAGKPVVRCVVRGAGGSSDTVVNHVKLGRYTSVVADVNKFVVNKIITGSLAQTLACEGGGA